MNRDLISRAAAELRDADPGQIIGWAVDQVGVNRISLACSFGAEDIVLLDWLHQVDPAIPVFYLDTELLFPETYQVRNQLAEYYQREFIRVTPSLSLQEQESRYGELWKQEPNRCCHLRKVEPLRQFLAEYQGWITGIRREQSPTRAQAQVLEWDDSFSMVKVNPLAYWISEEVWAYLRQHQLPYNPLHEQGYPSIGCRPCTRPVEPGEDPRAGRWSGTEKTECGLHNG